MTWYFDPTGTTMDVYDHTGARVAQDTPIAYNEDGDPVGGWTGGYPDRVLDIAREQKDGDQPSAYNQNALWDITTGNIEKGTPP